MDIKKIIKKLPVGFVDEVTAYGKEQLRSAIIQAESNIHTTQQEMAANERLIGAKEIVKDLAGPYRDATAAQRAKIAYVLHLLSERGELPESDA